LCNLSLASIDVTPNCFAVSSKQSAFIIPFLYAWAFAPEREGLLSSYLFCSYIKFITTYFGHAISLSRGKYLHKTNWTDTERREPCYRKLVLAHF
jgi:hypothetical protein